MMVFIAFLHLSKIKSCFQKRRAYLCTGDILFFGMLCKDQKVTYGSKIGYGWIQNGRCLSFVFVTFFF